MLYMSSSNLFVIFDLLFIDQYFPYIINGVM